MHLGTRLLIISQVIVGQPATLNCDVTGGLPEPRITWYKNSIPLTLNPEIQIFNQGKSIRISQTKVSFFYKYFTFNFIEVLKKVKVVGYSRNLTWLRILQS